MSEQTDRWNERYGANTEEYVFGTAPNDFLMSQVSALGQGRALCIGDGEGRNGVFLAEHGFTVTSVDLSAVGLAKAERLAASRGVRIGTVAADLVDFVAAAEGRGPWDAVVSIFCHMASSVRAVVYPPLIAALAPGGALLLESYTPEQIGRGTGGPPDPDMVMTESRLRDELSGLDVELLRTLERDVVEGAGHTGAAWVVQYLGRKPRS